MRKVLLVLHRDAAMAFVGMMAMVAVAGEEARGGGGGGVGAAAGRYRDLDMELGGPCAQGLLQVFESRFEEWGVLLAE